MLGSVLLAATAALPVVIPDPRSGPSPWRVTTVSEALPAAGAAGYLIDLPTRGQGVDQAWLERVVELGARGVPVVAVGAAVPAAALPYLDGVALEPPPEPQAFADVRATLGRVALVVAARDAGEAVAALADGAGAVLVPDPPAAIAAELQGLLAEPLPARSEAGPLPTALRGPDLATVVGLPRGFRGGAITLASDWYGAARFVGTETRDIQVRRMRGGATVSAPPAPSGGVLVVLRPADATKVVERVQVKGEELPSVAEVLARHQRAVARQQQILPRWRARQRLVVRVWVADLQRSFEVALEGPAFWQGGVGTDWEIVKAWVDGVAWDPDRLPDLPILEPKRPPVPPLALRLEPTYHYALEGTAEKQGFHCFVLSFTSVQERGKTPRRGTAWIDASSWGLVSFEERGEGLEGEVRATHATTTYRQIQVGTEVAWVPAAVRADDLLSAFGNAATVHRELTFDELIPNPPEFIGERAAAYAREHRMMRDATSGLVPLVPDGRGGRVAGGESRAAQRFVILGAVKDPGLGYPVPFGGFQIQDFNFRGRGEQLRLLTAGVVNDGAWVARRGAAELSLRGFLQLIPFTGTVAVRGNDQKQEELLFWHQRTGTGVATSVGSVRLLADAGVDKWNFSRTDNTARGFRLPANAWEGVLKLEAQAALGRATLSLTGESGWRANWRDWGLPGQEGNRPSWQRGRVALVHEATPFPLARLHLDAEYWFGHDLDRFSAPSPGRFSGVRLRGIASGRVIADRLGVVRGSIALPVSSRIRGELGVDAAWVSDPRSGYRARPLSGLGVGISAPGPWGTLLEATLGVPLATPGARSATFDLFLLRPLRARR